MPKFVHLHGHTQYSLLDGLSKIPQLVKVVKDLGMNAIAITDHGVMYGAIEFYKECLSAGIKPIIGVEMYVAKRGYTDKEGKLDSEPYHLTVLAKNYQGYLNLMKLTTIAHIKGYYYRPRVDKKLLKTYSQGLIALSGCPSGEFIRSLEDGRSEKTEEILKSYQEIFNEDFYLELQHHPYQDSLNQATDVVIKRDMKRLLDIQNLTKEKVKELSQKLGIKMVATNDFHYIKKEDAEVQDSLLCIQTGKFISEVERLRMIDTPDYYVKSPEEMEENFKDLPDALENTQKIADSVNIEIPLGVARFPVFQTQQGVTSMDYLRETTYEKAAEKLKLTEEIKQRLEHELGIIEKVKYADYFLVVSDFMEWAHLKGIITNTRGSAAGSLVLYCLGVTNLNPLDYLLPFERFLTIDRPTLPDIDADIADDRRDEVITYVMEKYGADRVAHIVTFGTMMGRAAIRDVGRVLGMAYGDVDRIAKLIPPPHQGFHKALSEAIKEVPDLANMYRSDPQVQKLLNLAIKIEGTVRHASIHAAGVVIAPDDITNFTPLQKESDGEKLVSQYDMSAVEDAGLVKMDLLGIRNLSILGKAVEFVSENQKKQIDLNKIPLDDKKAFELLAKGNTMGIFQLGSSGMTRYLVDLKPSSIADIAAMVALYRPGPLGVIPEYIQRKNNPKLIKYLDIRMKDYMEQSLGLLVYQEDVLFTAINLAGYSWEEADKFRKAMGKKNPTEMAKQKGKFVEGCIKNGMRKEKAEQIFALIAPFAAYGFNKCLVGETILYDAATGGKMTIKALYSSRKRPHLLSMDDDYTLNPRPVSNVSENGIKEVYQITTRRGLSIKCTDNHPFLTINGWTELKDLRVGSRIATSRWAPLPQEPYDIADFKIATLGYLLAEGNLCHPSGIYYYSTVQEEVDDFISYANQFDNSRIKLNYRKSATSVYVGRIYPKKPNSLFQWLSGLGLLNKKATQKIFPDFVYQLNQDQLSLLLAKMWQGDGLVSTREGGVFFYATSSKDLALGMQHLLLRLGVISTIHNLKFHYRGVIKYGWKIQISRHDNVKKFSETIGRYLIGRVKEACQSIIKNHPIISGQLNSLSARGSKDIIPREILPIIKEEVYANHPSLYSFASQYEVSVRLLWRDRRKVGYLRETVQNLALRLNSRKLHSLSHSDIYWDEVVSIESKGKEMTYDLTIPKTHNFVANDIIVHNSHAASYAMIAYQTAYMKANFPVEFMAAVMSAESGDTDKIAAAIEECKRLGIVVLPPDVNKSKVGFTLEALRDLSEKDLERSLSGEETRVKQGIRFGLSAIKNVGEVAIESIIKGRKIEEFVSLSDLCIRVDTRIVNRKTLESLIKAGALDLFGSRASQLLILDQVLGESHKLNKNKLSGQVSLFGGDGEEDVFKVKLPDVSELPLEQLLIFEKDLLGFYLHEPPYLAKLQNIIKFVTLKISEITDDHIGKSLILGGVITNVKKVITKKSVKEMAFIKVSDGISSIEAVVFPTTFDDSRDFLLKDEVVLIYGRIDKREEELSLVIDKLTVFDPNNIPSEFVQKKLGKVVEIYVPNGTQVTILQSVNKTLRNFPGDIPVALILPNGGSNLRRMDLPFSINPDVTLQKEIKKLLGSDAFRIV